MVKMLQNETHLHVRYGIFTALVYACQEENSLAELRDYLKVRWVGIVH